MDIVVHQRGDVPIAEVRSDAVILQTAQDALDLMAEAGARGARCIVFHQAAVAPEFFNLRSRLAGDILQKFSNYRVRFAVVCDLAGTASENLRAFVRESNRGDQTFFLPTLEAALDRLARAEGSV
jgi:hypothetical protein